MADPPRHPLVGAVRRFVENEVKPAACALDHADRYPHGLVGRMQELRLFGCLVPREYGGLGLPVSVYAWVIEELCRGWMSLAGVINSHTMMALIVSTHGTDEQRRRFLPPLARGDLRGGLCLTEPHAGSDVQAIRTRARREGEHYVVNGSKMFITNGHEGNAFALLAVTDPSAQPRYRGMSCFVAEKGHPGFQVVKSLSKLGYKGVDTVELYFENYVVPAANLVGGVEGRGFSQVMSGLETGRINIAARCVGVAQAALEDAAEWAATHGEAPPALADMATGVAASRLITYWAGGMKDASERCDLEAGMAKLLASETAQTVAVAAIRVIGEAATLTEHTVERHYRDTPLMIIGEGTNEIQRTLIARQLVDRYGERPGALTSREHEPDERRQIVLMVRQFVDKSLVPVAGELEGAGRRPDALVAELAGLGLLGALVRPDLGGLGLDLVTTVMILEELARGWTTVASVVAGHLVASYAIDRFASRGVRDALLPPMTRGERMGAAVFRGAVRARADASDIVLSGSTTLVDNGAHVDLMVLAATDARGRPLTCVVDAATAGVSRRAVAATLGQRGLEACSIVLDDARLAAAAVLEDDGRSRAVACLAVAAIATGLAQAAFEAALRYAQQRTTFGKPLAQHQAVQLKLADMASRITASRLLTSHAAASGDALGPEVGAATMARLWASTTAYETTLEAMRIHGGYGYVSEFPIERYYRDAARLMLVPADDDTLRRELAATIAARPDPVVG
jgi:alkylation response protein AidB-like acyl-CoA dehydrogenase